MSISRSKKQVFKYFMMCKNKVFVSASFRILECRWIINSKRYYWYVFKLLLEKKSDLYSYWGLQMQLANALVRAWLLNKINVSRYNQNALSQTRNQPMAVQGRNIEDAARSQLKQINRSLFLNKIIAKRERRKQIFPKIGQTQTFNTKWREQQKCINNRMTAAEVMLWLKYFNWLIVVIDSAVVKMLIVKFAWRWLILYITSSHTN